MRHPEGSESYNKDLYHYWLTTAVYIGLLTPWYPFGSVCILAGVQLIRNYNLS
jgi:hypothetical protein